MVWGMRVSMCACTRVGSVCDVLSCPEQPASVLLDASKDLFCSLSTSVCLCGTRVKEGLTGSWEAPGVGGAGN